MEPVICLILSPQNDLLLHLSSTKVNLLDAISGDRVIKWKSPSKRWYTDATWAEDGSRLLTSEEGGVVHVWDVASARSTKQIHLLFEYDTSHPTTSCSFFNCHRSILTDHGVFPIPLQHRPACAADDLMPPSPETLLRLRDDSWIWQVGGMNEWRVCWLPPAYRPVEPSFTTVFRYVMNSLKRNIATSQDKVMLVTDSGRLVSLGLKKWFGNAASGSYI
jgi:WD40 repeat protein